MKQIRQVALHAGRVLGLAACAAVLSTGMAGAAQATLKVGLGTPVVLEGQKQTAFLKVGITCSAAEGESARPPVNVAIVMDRSGSMTGEKLDHAKEAAIMAIDSLSANDIVSVITYDDTVNVLCPATKLTDRTSIEKAIRKIKPGGSTALFAGVSKGADELRKFREHNGVSRIVLLSDGLANVGPSTPDDLAQLGCSLAREGITVSTIGLGLGFNEDLMTQLAVKGGGSHYFAEMPKDLARAYEREFKRALSVVGQEAQVRVECAEGIRPVRVLGREAEIDGQRVIVSLNQLYSDSEKYVIMEVEIPAGTASSSRKWPRWRQTTQIPRR